MRFKVLLHLIWTEVGLASVQKKNDGPCSSAKTSAPFTVSDVASFGMLLCIIRVLLGVKDQMAHLHC